MLRREGLLFAVGSFLFALGALPGYATLVGTGADDLTYFAGSIFFTSAGYLQLRGSAAGADRWASAIQSAGTVAFNVSTGLAMVHNLSAAQEDRYVWRPDAVGSVCFLVASAIALRIATGGDRPIAWWNMVGSVAFGISAVGAYVIQDSGDLRNATAANLGTFIGAICFLVGALLLVRLSRTARPG
jgi:hypothetical protein